jgi:hypothetical protein
MGEHITVMGEHITVMGEHIMVMGEHMHTQRLWGRGRLYLAVCDVTYCPAPQPEQPLGNWNVPSIWQKGETLPGAPGVSR